MHTCGDLVASVPFFEDAEEGFTTSIVTLLRPTVRAPVPALLPLLAALLLCNVSLPCMAI